MPEEISNTVIAPSPIGSSAAPDLRILRGQDIRTNPELLAGEQGTGALLTTFAPVVSGLAAALVPEDPTATELITIAVFQVFALGRRRVPRRDLIGVWLFQ